MQISRKFQKICLLFTDLFDNLNSGIRLRKFRYEFISVLTKTYIFLGLFQRTDYLLKIDKNRSSSVFPVSTNKM